MMIQKKASTFFNMVMTLLVITLIAGFTLGYVNELTIEPKAKAKLDRKIKAIKLVLPEFDNNPIKAIRKIHNGTSKDSIELYPAFKNQKFIGAAVTGYSDKGYNGLVKIMVGFTVDARIENIEVIEQKETPGLGTKMKNKSFLQQFQGKNPNTYILKVSKDGGDVDAITGATISTRAFNESVKMAYQVFMTYSKEYNTMKL